MEELLLTYNEQPFVSDPYRAGLDRVGTRAEQMARRRAGRARRAGRDAGPGQRAPAVGDAADRPAAAGERIAARAPEIARDVAALDRGSAPRGRLSRRRWTWSRALADPGGRPDGAARDGAAGSRSTRWSTPSPFSRRRTTSARWRSATPRLFARICGASDRRDRRAAAPPRRRGAMTAGAHAGHGDHPRVRRGAPSARLAPLVGSKPSGTAQRNAAELLGEIGRPGRGAAAPAAAARPRRARDARRRSARCRTSRTRRRREAVHTVLRAATGDQRRAVVGGAGAAARRPRRPGAGAHPRRERSVRRRSRRSCSRRWAPSARSATTRRCPR